MFSHWVLWKMTLNNAANITHNIPIGSIADKHSSGAKQVFRSFFEFVPLRERSEGGREDLTNVLRIVCDQLKYADKNRS